MPDRREELVRKMVAEGTSDEDIRATLKAFDAQQPAAAAPPRTWGDTARDVGIGAAKGLFHSATDLASTAAQSGMVPGLSQSTVPVMAAARDATPYTNAAQFTGGALETAAELAPGAIALGRAAAGAAPAIVRAAGPSARVAGGAALDVAMGHPIRALGKVLRFALDAAKPAAAEVSENVGGRLSKVKVPRNQELADALAELRSPEPPQSVELPPAPELPPGYTPRTSAPEYVPPQPATQTPAPPGRLVPAAPRPTAEQIAADALADTRKATPPARVTTPPPAELPPGYQPRTTVHGPRNYFLKTDAVTPEPAPPSSGVSLSDLPASWQKMTAPPVIAPREIEGSGLAAAYQQELIRRGVKPSQAIVMVRRNPDIPADVKAIIVKALETVARNKS